MRADILTKKKTPTEILHYPSSTPLQQEPNEMNKESEKEEVIQIEPPVHSEPARVTYEDPWVEEEDYKEDSEEDEDMIVETPLEVSLPKENSPPSTQQNLPLETLQIGMGVRLQDGSVGIITKKPRKPYSHIWISILSSTGTYLLEEELLPSSHIVGSTPVVNDLPFQETALGGFKATPEDLEKYTEGFKAAYLKEYGRWFETGAVVPVPSGFKLPQGTKAVPTTDIKEMKIVKEGLEKEPKVRLVVLGNMDRTVAETYSPTPSLPSIYLLLSLAISNGWKSVKGDLSTAFLQAPMSIEEDVYLRLPTNVPKYVTEKYPCFTSGAIVKVVKSIYGLRYSPRSYTEWFAEEIMKEGYVRVAPSVFVRRVGDMVECILIVYVDDLLCLSPTALQDLEQLKSRFKMTDIKELTEGERFRYLGLNLETEQGAVKVGSTDYVQLLSSSKYGLGEVGYSDNMLRPGEFLERRYVMDKVEESLVPEYRRLIGVLGWICKTWPELNFPFSFLSQFNTKPTLRAIAVLRKVLVYVFNNHQPLKLVALHVPELELQIFSDASYDCLACSARLGYIMMLCSRGKRNIIDWKSGKLTRKIGSTTVAEMFALIAAVKRTYLHVNLLAKLNIGVRVVFFIDSQPLKDQLVSEVCQKEPKYQSTLELLVQDLKELGASVSLVGTKDMVADGLTKFRGLLWTRQTQ